MDEYEKHLLLTCLERIDLTSRRQEFLIGKIMTQLNELAPKLEALNAQLIKVKEEIATQVAALQDALVNVALSPEAEAALTALSAQAQILDDINPDAPVVEPVPVEEQPAP